MRRRRLVVLLEIIVPVIVLLLVLVLVEVVLVRLVSERKEGGGGKAAESVNAKVEVGCRDLKTTTTAVGRSAERATHVLIRHAPERQRPHATSAAVDVRSTRRGERARASRARPRASISEWGSERERDEGVFVVAERQAPPNNDSDVLSALPRRSDNPSRTPIGPIFCSERQKILPAELWRPPLLT